MSRSKCFVVVARFVCDRDWAEQVADSLKEWHNDATGTASGTIEILPATEAETELVNSREADEEREADWLA